MGLPHRLVFVFLNAVDLTTMWHVLNLDHRGFVQGKMARSWPLRYLIRHTAFHTLDHAWEMEDKDLTAKPI